MRGGQGDRARTAPVPARSTASRAGPPRWCESVTVVCKAAEEGKVGGGVLCLRVGIDRCESAAGLLEAKLILVSAQRSADGCAANS
jgi:hypothetical protein